MSTAPRRRTRLGFGEFVPHDEAVEFARWVFLEEVARLYPDVLADLRTRTADDLADWAQAWNLNDPWILEFAEATRRTWTEYPSVGNYWSDSDQPGEIAAIQRRPTPPVYYPELQSRGQYLEAHQAYLDECERLASRAGTRPPRKDPTHFEWLIHYQVGHESYAALSMKDSSITSPRTMSGRCKSLASFIGLTRRPARQRSSTAKAQK